MNKNIIIAGAIAIGAYLLSQGKEILSIPDAYTMRQKVAQKRIGHPITRAAYIAAAQKVAERVPERRPVLPAIPMSKKIAQKISSAATPATRRRIAEKIAQERARRARKKALESVAAARRILFQRHVMPSLPSGAQILQNIIHHVAVRTGKTNKEIQKEFARIRKAQRVAQAKKAIHNPYRSSFPATGPKNIVHITPARQKIAQKISQRISEKGVAPWKVPFIFPKSKFRVITPSDRLRKLAERDIARKKAVPQKTSQKTTPDTPSARRKRRLRALYGSHWRQVWIQRPRRR